MLITFLAIFYITYCYTDSFVILRKKNKKNREKEISNEKKCIFAS